MNKQTLYLQRIHNTYPTLEIRTARLYTGDGQFNDIMIINEELIFRFPRSQQAAQTLAKEIIQVW